MDRSETLGELATALRNFQEKQEAIQFDSKNDFLKNKYATLGALIKGSKQNLADNGLSVTQLMEDSGVRTMLIHVNGEYISAHFAIEATASKGTTHAQQVGIATTYARRYAYASILGLVTEEDKDGVYAGGAVDDVIGDAVDAAETIEELEAIWKGLNGKQQKEYKVMISGRKSQLGG